MKDDMKIRDSDSTEKGCVVAMIPFFVSTIFVAPIVRGWVLCKLWAWFIVPTFSLPSLHIVTAIGLMVVAAFIVSIPIPETKDKGEEMSVKMFRAIAMSFATPLISLVMGWVVQRFM